MFETQYEALRRQGISRRSFLQFFTTLTANSPESCEQRERHSFYIQFTPKQYAQRNQSVESIKKGARGSKGNVCY